MADETRRVYFTKRARPYMPRDRAAFPAAQALRLVRDQRVAVYAPSEDETYPEVEELGLPTLGEPSDPRSVDTDEDEEPGLGDLTKAELVELAEERGIEVERGDGEDGSPLKADYLAALEAAENADGSEEGQTEGGGSEDGEGQDGAGEDGDAEGESQENGDGPRLVRPEDPKALPPGYEAEHDDGGYYWLRDPDGETIFGPSEGKWQGADGAANAAWSHYAGNDPTGGGRTGDGDGEEEE